MPDAQRLDPPPLESLPGGSPVTSEFLDELLEVEPTCEMPTTQDRPTTPDALEFQICGKPAVFSLHLACELHGESDRWACQGHLILIQAGAFYPVGSLCCAWLAS